VPILRIEIPDELHQRIDAQKPEYLDRKGFVCLILDQALDRVGRVPAYRVGAGETPVQAVPVVQTSEAQQPQVPTQAVPSSKGKNFKKHLSLIPKLEKFEDLILEFFRIKKGSKSETAWSHLMTGLSSIQEKYGDTVVQEQLMAAINGKWASVTLKNYEQYGLITKKGFTPAEPQHKHPAYRDASDVLAESERIAQQNLEHLRRKQEESQATGGVLDGLF